MKPEEPINEPKFEAPCICIIMHKDGEIELSNIMTFQSSSINYAVNLANSPVGYIVLTKPSEDGESTVKYVISQYRPVLYAYKEAFIIGRNIDYVSYEDFTDYLKFWDICKESEKKLVKE